MSYAHLRWSRPQFCSVLRSAGFQFHCSQPALFIRKRSLQEHDNLIFGQRLEHIDSTARKQRADDLERWVLRGRTDQRMLPFST